MNNEKLNKNVKNKVNLDIDSLFTPNSFNQFISESKAYNNNSSYDKNTKKDSNDNNHIKNPLTDTQIYYNPDVVNTEEQENSKLNDINILDNSIKNKSIHQIINNTIDIETNNFKIHRNFYKKRNSNNNSNNNNYGEANKPSMPLTSIIKQATKNLISNYNYYPNDYNKNTINNIIYNERCQITSEFKELLIYDDCGEFLKRFYTIIESQPRIANVSNYYETYTLINPCLSNLREYKYLSKNYKKKFRILCQLMHNNNKNNNKQMYYMGSSTENSNDEDYEVSEGIRSSVLNTEVVDLINKESDSNFFNKNLANACSNSNNHRFSSSFVKVNFNSGNYNTSEIISGFIDNNNTNKISSFAYLNKVEEKEYYKKYRNSVINNDNANIRKNINSSFIDLLNESLYYDNDMDEINFKRLISTIQTVEDSINLFKDNNTKKKNANNVNITSNKNRNNIEVDFDVDFNNINTNYKDNRSPSIIINHITNYSKNIYNNNNANGNNNTNSNTNIMSQYNNRNKSNYNASANQLLKDIKLNLFSLKTNNNVKKSDVNIRKEKKSTQISRVINSNTQLSLNKYKTIENYNRNNNNNINSKITKLPFSDINIESKFLSINNRKHVSSVLSGNIRKTKPVTNNIKDINNFNLREGSKGSKNSSRSQKTYNSSNINKNSKNSKNCNSSRLTMTANINLPSSVKKLNNTNMYNLNLVDTTIKNLTKQSNLNSNKNTNKDNSNNIILSEYYGKMIKSKTPISFKTKNMLEKYGKEFDINTNNSTNVQKTNDASIYNSKVDNMYYTNSIGINDSNLIISSRNSVKRDESNFKALKKTSSQVNIFSNNNNLNSMIQQANISLMNAKSRSSSINNTNNNNVNTNKESQGKSNLKFNNKHKNITLINNLDIQHKKDIKETLNTNRSQFSSTNKLKPHNNEVKGKKVYFDNNSLSRKKKQVVNNNTYVLNINTNNTNNTNINKDIKNIFFTNSTYYNKSITNNTNNIDSYDHSNKKTYSNSSRKSHTIFQNNTNYDSKNKKDIKKDGIKTIIDYYYNNNSNTNNNKLERKNSKSPFNGSSSISKYTISLLSHIKVPNTYRNNNIKENMQNTLYKNQINKNEIKLIDDYSCRNRKNNNNDDNNKDSKVIKSYSVMRSKLSPNSVSSKLNENLIVKEDSKTNNNFYNKNLNNLSKMNNFNLNVNQDLIVYNKQSYSADKVNYNIKGINIKKIMNNNSRDINEINKACKSNRSSKDKINNDSNNSNSNIVNKQNITKALISNKYNNYSEKNTLLDNAYASLSNSTSNKESLNNGKTVSDNINKIDYIIKSSNKLSSINSHSKNTSNFNLENSRSNNTSNTNTSGLLNNNNPTNNTNVKNNFKKTHQPTKIVFNVYSNNNIESNVTGNVVSNVSRRNDNIISVNFSNKKQNNSKLNNKNNIKPNFHSSNTNNKEVKIFDNIIIDSKSHLKKNNTNHTYSTNNTQTNDKNYNQIKSNNKKLVFPNSNIKAINTVTNSNTNIKNNSIVFSNNNNSKQNVIVQKEIVSLNKVSSVRNIFNKNKL